MEQNIYNYYASFGNESQHHQMMESYFNQHQYSMAAMDPVYYYNIPAFVELNQHGFEDNNSNFNQSYHMHQHHSPPPTPKVIEKHETASTSSSSASPSSATAVDFKIKCENCGRELSSRKRYQNHYAKCVNKTKNPKTFNCVHCASEFRVKKSFEKHMSEVHGELPRIINANLGNRQERQAIKVSIFHSIELLAVSDSK